MLKPDSQVHFRIPETIYKKLKIKCILEGTSIKEYMKKVVIENLERDAPTEIFNDNVPSVDGKLIELLRLNPIFKPCGNSELEKVIRGAIHLEYRKGCTIYRQGEVPSVIYFIQSGKVFIYRQSPSGKQLIIDMRTKGEIFASLASILSKPSIATSKVIEDAMLIGIKKENFVSFLFRNQGTLLTFIENQDIKVINAYSKLLDLLDLSAKERLVDSLLVLSSKFGETLNFTHQEIAEICGTSSETTSRILSQLKRSGAIQLARGKIVILDRNKMVTRP